MKAVPHELIAQRAYEIWEHAGWPHGQDKVHWEQAERELLEAAPQIKAEVAIKSNFTGGAAADVGGTFSSAAEPQRTEISADPLSGPH